MVLGKGGVHCFYLKWINICSLPETGLLSGLQAQLPKVRELLRTKLQSRPTHGIDL